MSACLVVVSLVFLRNKHSSRYHKPLIMNTDKGNMHSKILNLHETKHDYQRTNNTYMINYNGNIYGLFVFEFSFKIVYVNWCCTPRFNQIDFDIKHDFHELLYAISFECLLHCLLFKRAPTKYFLWKFIYLIYTLFNRSRTQIWISIDSCTTTFSWLSSCT